ncbi:MAG: type II/IV secretion system protein [Candidatus Nomurabacteria bacterium]|nr:type II/IV secretion system protein [Candidatus Nomurabacteria bacterium]USN87313.1 MAG: type II/IV secretion system protein [Candidatus Nomurabacteria bacterium]
MIKFNDQSSNTRIADLRKSEEEKLVQILAPQRGYDYINLHGYTINPEAVALYPEKKARAANLVIFDSTHDLLSVAVKNPSDPVTEQALAEIQNNRQNIQVFMCSTGSLEHAWERYADLVKTSARKKGVFDIDTNDIAAYMSHIKNKEDAATELKNISTINNSKRVTETIEMMFAGAISLYASDIHIEPEENVIRVRYRLDGVLHDIFDIDRYIYERLMSRLKLLAGMTLNKRQEAQDGRFTFVVIDRELEIRVSVIPGASGESMVMRLLDPSVATFRIENIDLNPIIRKVVDDELKKPNGLIITTGPTGSGKTTALYTFLKETHKEGVKIITIENPVEYKLEGIVQTQIGDEYTFASGLRAILRQDPDIIMIGEIRDHEVAETAIHAAQTGHLVFSTLHTNSAVGGFPRLLDLGIDARIISSSVSLMMGQRLMRKLCNDCKQQYEAPPEEIRVVKDILSQHPGKPTVPEPLILFKAVGCTACGGTGFKGRMGIFEAIRMDEKVEEVIIRDPREHAILEAAAPQGIPTMVEDGVEKVVRGITSLAELERVVVMPKPKSDLVPETEMGSDDLFLAHTIA